MSSGNQLRSRNRASNNGVRAQRASRASAASLNNSDTSPMHAERLRKLYAAMLKCRIMDGLVPTDVKERCVCSSRESIVAGTAIHLSPQDLISPTPAELFARLVQGAPLESIGASLKEELDRGFGDAKTRMPAMSTALAQLQVGVGMALACKLQSRPSVTLCIVEESTDQADFWHGPVECAARRRLAIVFVLVNATGEARSLHPDPRGKTREILPAIVVDGNDAVAVYRVAEECMRRARQGLGPSVVECLVENGRDPVHFMENYLEQRSMSPAGWKENILREFGRQAESVLKRHLGRTPAA